MRFTPASDSRIPFLRQGVVRYRLTTGCRSKGNRPVPVSKQRRRAKPQSRRPNKSAEARARATQAAQKEAERKKAISPAAYARRRFLGWTLVTLGVVVGLQHLI